MENNLSRLECKLKEIISDSREGHSTNYSKSIREDHLHGSAFGLNAFTLDDSATGTTIFMPWKLHKPLESLFYEISVNSVVSHTSFKSFVDNFGLFPNFQNSRKKDDILDYILKRCNNHHGPLNFEEFLLALFLLAKYRASVLRSNEQFAFNELLNSVLKNSPQLNPAQFQEELNLNLGGLENQFPSRTSSKNLDGVIYHDNGLIVDTNIGKVYESPRKLKTQDFSNPVNETEQPVDSSINNTGSVDAELLHKLLEVLRDQNLLVDNRNLHERLEREVKLRDVLESRYIDRLNHLESEKDELSKECQSFKLKNTNLEIDLENLELKFNHYKSEKENDVVKLTTENERLSEELAKMKEKVERHNFLTERNQKMQKLLVLETEFEVKLFSIFCIYKDEHCVNGEFVITEDQLISFCIDFGLGESEPPANPNEDPRAKQAYNKVYEFSYEGMLNYSLFKEFLMNFGLLLKPQLTPEEAFRFIVFQLVFISTENSYGEEPVDDYHPVYVTDGNDPWNTNFPVSLRQQMNTKPTDPERFVDVEGKVWFDKHTLDPKQTGYDSSSTPRFE